MGKRIVLWLCLMLAVACCVQAEVLHVSPDGLSLTQALASCADGDVIELADGVFVAVMGYIGFDRNFKLFAV